MIILKKGALCPKLNNKNQNDKYIFFTCYFFARNLERNEGGNVRNAKKYDIQLIIRNSAYIALLNQLYRKNKITKDEYYNIKNKIKNAN